MDQPVWYHPVSVMETQFHVEVSTLEGMPLPKVIQAAER